MAVCDAPRKDGIYTFLKTMVTFSGYKFSFRKAKPTDRSRSDCVHEQSQRVQANSEADCECPLYY